MAGDKEVADRLRQARVAAGYDSAAEAADALDMREPSYAAHENGGRAFSLQKAVEYAKFFDVNLVWLATGAGPIKGPPPIAAEHHNLLDGLPAQAREQLTNLAALLRNPPKEPHNSGE